MKREKTVTVEVTLTLSANLAQEAESKGLLTPEALESLLRAEIRQRNINRLFDAADRVSSIDFPPMTEEELEAEIQAVRNEKQKSRAAGS